MPRIAPGYAEADVEQHSLGVTAGNSDRDHRSPFQHDVDRAIYAPEFRALSGRTQVTAADQLGAYHNRLTHTLKVAQLGKRAATLLTDRAHDDGHRGAGPDPDLVEAACLIHDIGHPPFGHIGELQIRSTLDALAEGGRYGNGFQANAQNLRIVGYMAVRRDRAARGLNLTRAVLDAAVKYPWRRGDDDDTYASTRWGCYADQEETLRWVLDTDTLPNPPASRDEAPRRPVEEQIMDWADEVTYACHDVEDFYRAGLIPLDEILRNLPRELPSVSRATGSHEINRFLEYLERRKDATPGDLDEAVRSLWLVQNVASGPVFPYDGSSATRGKAAAVTSYLISEFVGPEAIHLEPVGDAEHLTRYGSRLVINDAHRRAVETLGNLLWCYVIDRPGLASQQAGQRRIVDELVRWYSAEPSRLLPESRREEFEGHRGADGHGDALRAAADTVASLTETQAMRIHQRMSGVDYGQLTDVG